MPLVHGPERGGNEIIFGMKYYARAHKRGWHMWRKSISGSVIFLGWFSNYSNNANVEIVG